MPLGSIPAGTEAGCLLKGGTQLQEDWPGLDQTSLHQDGPQSQTLPDFSPHSNINNHIQGYRLYMLIRHTMHEEV